METYNTNTSFKQYVEAFCKKHKLTVEEALKIKEVQETEKYYQDVAALLVGK